jgi:hypothetical protein
MLLLRDIQLSLRIRLAKCPSLSKLMRMLRAVEERISLESLESFRTAGIRVRDESSKTEAKNASIIRICPLLSFSSLT